MASCLSIVQSVCGMLGLAVPNQAVGSTDAQVAAVLAMVNKEGQALCARDGPWTAILKEATFTTLAAEDQGAVETIAPGLNYIINDTIWNRSLRRPVFGPRSAQDWQKMKAYALLGPWSSHRVRGGHLYMYPTPAAGQSCYFEYASTYWCTDSSGVTSRDAFTDDTDVPLLDYKLIVLGALWRWKHARGFEYAEDFREYERRVTDALARDGGRESLSMSGQRYDITPAVVIPAGSWSV